MLSITTRVGLLVPAVLIVGREDGVGFGCQTSHVGLSVAHDDCDKIFFLLAQTRTLFPFSDVSYDKEHRKMVTQGI